MRQLPTIIPTDTWVKSLWEEYLQTLDQINNKKAKGYDDDEYYC